MNKLLLVLLLCATNARAGYFRLFNPDKVNRVIGASIDPITPEQTSFVTEVALITHSPNDGCWFPSIVCEDWSPFMVGPTYNAGRFAVVFGPVANMAPIVKVGLFKAVGVLTGEGEWLPLKALLTPSDSNTIMSFGPQMWINPVQNGKFMPFNKWAPAGRVFAGAELKF